MPRHEPEAILARIAEILGVPVAAFYDNQISGIGEPTEFLMLWRAIKDPADRRKVVALMRTIVERQPLNSSS